MDYKAEEILNKVQQIYSGSESKSKYGKIGTKQLKTSQNLEEIGRDELFQLNLESSQDNIPKMISRPSKNLTVLVIGNHSAGKSSFINWYVEEKVQNTGIAIETSHFTMVKFGDKKVEIQSEGTLALYPFLREIMKRSRKEVYGKFFSNLTTKTCTNKVKNIEKIDFIDTPGLTDGNVDYDCDIIEMIKWVSTHVDAILVFLDPVGQALCTKTMNMIEYLYQNHKRKTSICLSKIDQVDPDDFNKLSMQVYSAIIARTHDIHLDVIPISTIKDYKGPNNKISSLMEKFEKIFNDKAIRNIEIMTSDCNTIIDHCNNLIEYDNRNKRSVSICKVFKVFLLLLFISLLLFTLYYLLTSESQATEKELIGLISPNIILLLILILSRKFEKATFAPTQLLKITNWIKYCKSAITEGEEMTQDYLNS